MALPSSTSDASSDTPKEHTHTCTHTGTHKDLCTHTHVHTPGHPHSPYGAQAGKVGHTAQEGTVSGMGRGKDGSGQSGLAASALSQSPNLDNLYKAW